MHEAERVATGGDHLLEEEMEAGMPQESGWPDLQMAAVNLNHESMDCLRRGANAEAQEKLMRAEDMLSQAEHFCPPESAAELSRTRAAIASSRAEGFKRQDDYPMAVQFLERALEIHQAADAADQGDLSMPTGASSPRPTAASASDDPRSSFASTDSGGSLSSRTSLSEPTSIAEDQADVDGLAPGSKTDLVDSSEQSAALLKAFKFFDTNESGQIEVNALKHIVTTLGERLTAQEFQDSMNLSAGIAHNIFIKAAAEKKAAVEEAKATAKEVADRVRAAAEQKAAEEMAAAVEEAKATAKKEADREKAAAQQKAAEEKAVAVEEARATVKREASQLCPGCAKKAKTQPQADQFTMSMILKPFHL